MAKPFRTQIRLQQITGSFGNVAGKIQDDVTIKDPKGSIAAGDLTGSLSYMAAAIRRIHGNADFSNADSGIFHQDLKPDGHYSGTPRDLGAPGVAWGDVHAQNYFGSGSFHTVAISDLTNTRVVLAGTNGELEDNANFTFDGTTLVANSALTVGASNAGAVAIDGTTLSIDGTDDSNLTVTANGKDLDIAVAGGGAQELRIASAGTGASALHLNASAGGINIDSADMIDIDAADEITIDTTSADGHIAVTSAHTAGQAILISANAAAQSILDVDAGILDIDVQGAATIDAGAASTFQTSAGDFSLVAAAAKVILSGSSAADSVHVQSAATFDDNVVIAGNLDVNGTVTTIDTTNITVKDRLLGLNYDDGTEQALADAGLIIGNSGGNQKAFIWDNTETQFALLDTTSDADATVVATTDYADLRLGALIADDSVTVTGLTDNQVVFPNGAGLLEGSANLTFDGNDLQLADDIGLVFSTDDAEKIESDGTDLTVSSGGKINLTATSDVILPDNVGMLFGDVAAGGEKIEGNGTGLTISGGSITLDSENDIVFDVNAKANLFAFQVAGTKVGHIQSGSMVGSNSLLLSSSEGRDLDFDANSGNFHFISSGSLDDIFQLSMKDDNSAKFKQFNGTNGTATQFLEFDFSNNLMLADQPFRMNTDKELQFRDANTRLMSRAANELEIRGGSAAGKINMSASFVSISNEGTSAGDTGALRLMDQSGDKFVAIKAADSIGADLTFVLPNLAGLQDDLLRVAGVSGTTVTLGYTADAGSQRQSRVQTVQTFFAGGTAKSFNDAAFAAAAGPFARSALDISTIPTPDLRDGLDMYLNGQMLVSGSNNGTAVDPDADYHLTAVRTNDVNITFGFDVEPGDVVSLKVR